MENHKMFRVLVIYAYLSLGYKYAWLFWEIAQSTSKCLCA
jgi:hypothetical protein